jgi:hypothetical protein
MSESYETRVIRQESDYQAIRVKSTAFYTARFEGRGEFYSGIRNGDNVALMVETQTYTDSDGIVKAGTVSMSIQSLRNPGGWLCLYNDSNRLSDITPMSDLVSAALVANRLTREIQRGYGTDDSYAQWLESRDEFGTGLGEIDAA